LNSPLSYLYQEDLYTVPASVIVVVPRPWHNILDSEKALLAKILGSVRVSIESVTIVYQESVSMQSLKVLKAQKILVFGSSVSGGINSYEHVKLDGVSVIRADDFSALDDGKKKSLWLALKQMFGV
jgi:hypothetical protein